MRFKAEIGGRVIQFAPLPFAFWEDHCIDLEQKDAATQDRVMFDGLVASAARAGDPVTREELRELIDIDELMQVWCMIADRSGLIRARFSDVTRGNVEPVLTASVFQQMMANPILPAQTGPGSMPESQPAPAGLSSTSETK